MHLYYYLDGEGKRVYTLSITDPDGNRTVSAHPARFSPVDPYSKQRITWKRRHNLLPIDKPKKTIAKRSQ